MTSGLWKSIYIDSKNKSLMIEESKGVLKDAIDNIILAAISSTHIDTATKIAERCLGVQDINLSHQFMDPRKFSGGEFCPRFTVDITGKSVYVLLLPSPYKTPEELVQRACMAAVSAKENNAGKVVLIATDLPHARQDRGPSEDKTIQGEPTTIRWNARQFKAAGIDKIITMHEHSPRIAAYFALEYGLISPEKISERARTLPPAQYQVPHDVDMNDPEVQAAGRAVFQPIPPQAFLADYLRHSSSLTSKLGEGEGIVLKAMDEGNKKFIDDLHEALFLPGVSRVYCKKKRSAKNDPNSIGVEIVGVSDNFDSLEGKIEIYADDGLDTGGTMLKAVEWSNQGNKCPATGKKYGKPKERIVYFTHPWLGGEAHQIIQERLYKNLPAREFITTNTRPFVDDSQYYRFKTKSTVLRFAGLWADAILANELGQDVMGRYAGFSSEEEQHQFLAPLYALKRHSWHFMVDETQRETREVTFYKR